MFRGFATINFYAEDLAAARDWYAEVLEVQPYYVVPEPPAPPVYVEFRIGDDQDELGFVDRRYAPPGPPAVLSCLDQLECHLQTSRTGTRTLGDLRAVSDARRSCPVERDRFWCRTRRREHERKLHHGRHRFR